MCNHKIAEWSQVESEKLAPSSERNLKVVGPQEPDVPVLLVGRYDYQVRLSSFLRLVTRLLKQRTLRVRCYGGHVTRKTYPQRGHPRSMSFQPSKGTWSSGLRPSTLSNPTGSRM